MKVLAFYLPQYHPIPENDEWWGKGFTEWTTLTKALPLFKGHAQPRLPGELGYYDLRLPEVREAQADLAMDAGVTGFMYWHYWFGDGRRILERPFNEMLTSRQPGIDFALAWANESWSRRWYGDETTLLMEQTYPGAHDIEDHFSHLLPAFEDERYTRIDGKPVFMVYRPQDLPNAGQFVEIFNTLANRSGFPGMYLIAGNSESDPREAGFDATYAQPSLVQRSVLLSSPTRAFTAIARKTLEKGGPLLVPYDAMMDAFHARAEAPWVEHVAVFPNWDNTPRRGRGGIVVTGTSPANFETQVRRSVQHTRTLPEESQLMFVKSWNEWAEGNYIEPDLEHGRAWLDALSHGMDPM